MEKNNSKKVKTRDIIVNKTDSPYTINYQLFDRFGSKISGTYTGTLQYFDGTASSSGVAAKVRKPGSKGKSFNSLQNGVMRIKEFRDKN